MAAGDRKYFSNQLVALLVGATLCSYFGSVPASYGQANTSAQDIGKNIPEGAKLLLSANELVYNRDADLVSAVGGVQINYGGYKMVAQKVEYNQKTGRMMALGNVELVSPDGNRIYADNLDVTDNFADGFLNSLRIETADNTRIVAESGERVGGTMMILNKGVYTACLPCAEDPKRAPFWQVKAQRVIQNGETHTIRLERTRFELLGHPIAFLPFIEVPDNTVKRKSGFLFPTMSLSQNLGFGLSVPYYYVISPSMDATVTATGYTAQGFLIEGEFRQRFENGTHILRVAGIDQAKPGNFSSGTSDAEAEQRGMVASKADFRINPRWTFGWDVMTQSDNNFSKTYKLRGLTGTDRTNQIYLTGLGKRNYFDMRAFYFDVQDADRTNTAEKQQAIVYPSLDYHYVAPQPLAGGELSADVNLTNISRTHDDFYTVDGFDRFRGLKGQTSRLTAELQWKRTYVTPTGLVITPLLAARGDAFALNMDDPTGYTGNYVDGNSATRSMFTAGLEMRYPILMTTDNSTHILEPIAQIYARPDEQLAGRLPNEDAQSFVFDATSLFDRDKFSGYDRVEGGTRANVGVQYTGTFDSGYKLHGIFGQSYQIAGQNSFATDDLVNVGADSGLETDRSDYVGLGGVETPYGVSVAASYRLDEKDFEFRRGDLTTAYQNDTFSTQLTYTHLSAQPAYGFAEDNDEIQTNSTVKFKDYWSIFGGIAWDLNNDVISRRTLGLSYEDECTIFTIAYTDSRDSDDESGSDWTIGARLTFRTLGDIKIGSDTLE
ncbi:LPS-assembly protein LptD [Rhizobium sp. 1AS11]|uniref:LPS-assembly protein LptD n=1 Tax=Rhizobium acaciae TaxID=2989736 RepID=UPI00027D7949|nr:LPS-assembly protein LptD [Rhizobium acaciae]EJC70374.1 organic solvent tolerance protein OstA [Rhizobium leguminosarum bv. viciae WSM1455]MCW1413763.1 LPS-assembly protein LptD [Rhizobium acaciae]MCW1745933.1 LPS-assembly protein LptD [Rhizobium acaciae]MCW1754724.1 LPS-assembly protein LptD [Rhizobium acaciae]